MLKHIGYMAKKNKKEQPINNVQWVDREKLRPNDYNPNVVAPAELRLLKISIMEDGWTQPIVVNSDFTIVDGFHRYSVAADKEISEMTDGKVPVVVLAPTDKAQQKMATIRHNRARGTHVVVRMSEIVKAMIDEGLPVEEIMERLQMEREEVVRLMTRAGIPKTDYMKDKDFGNSWKPG